MSTVVTPVLLVLCTCPTAEDAERIARALLDARVAACVTRLAAAHSWYRWDGAIERADEWPLLIKTTRDRYDALERTLKALHGYEVPEILAFEASSGLAAYLSWVNAATREPVEESA